MRSRNLSLILLLMSVSAVTAQDPSAEDDGFSFEQHLYEGVREGYVTLRWDSVPDATEYEVIDGLEKSVYRGALTEAFVSGLSDGEHSFGLRAMDASGSIIATASPATVVVDHWPLSYAIGLFAIGFAVVTGVVVVIARGALSKPTELENTDA